MKYMRINYRATLYFNFKFLPFRQALHLPFILYNKIRFLRTSGRVILDCDKVKCKMVQIGAHGSDMFSGSKCLIDVAGDIIIHGDKIRIGYGSLVRVENQACLEFYENSILGARNIIFCCKNIVFHTNSLFSWDCQIMDSDTHSLWNAESKEYNEITKSIVVGKNTWIGNHVIINKGTVLPEGTIVSSMSLCNKDYSEIIEEHCVIGGVPAKLLKTNMIRKSLNASFMDKKIEIK